MSKFHDQIVFHCTILCPQKATPPPMDVCSKNPNRTAPVSEGGPRRVDLPLCSRTNGWSWPPHPFQLLAWILYLYFAVTGFGVFVPLLPSHWIPAGYIVSFDGSSTLLRCL